MDVKTIGVIGAGAKGREIACTSLIAGFHTVLEDVSLPLLDQGVAYIRETLNQAVAGAKLTLQQMERAVQRLSTAHKVEDVCRQADLLIEALPEELELQLEIFTIFDKFAMPDAILASSARSLSLTDLAAITFRAENCVGMHFQQPVADTKLLEIIRAPETSDATVATCGEVGRRMGKEVLVQRELSDIVPDRSTSRQE